MTQTEKKAEPMAETKARSDSDQASSTPPIAPGQPVQPLIVAGLAVGALLLVGWGLILYANRWHFTIPVFFLFVGWVAVLATARFLWNAGWAVGSATGDEDQAEFWRPVGKDEELLAEKKILLKAIKDVEFDFGLGKMSKADADQLTSYYRARAIEVIKALTALEDGSGGAASGDGDESLTVAQRIERDVAARMDVDKHREAARSKGAKRAAKVKASRAKAASTQPARDATGSKAATNTEATGDSAEVSQRVATASESGAEAGS